MRIILCYESVIPAKGGAEHYISDLARALVNAGHEVHLFACRWDASALCEGIIFHTIPPIHGPRFVRPWRFAFYCLKLLQSTPHDVSIGFDKTFGQDILYPQGGLHSASRYHNLLKYPSKLSRLLAKIGRLFDPTSFSFSKLERQQYLYNPPYRILVNSQMVKRHFQEFLGLSDRIHVLYSSIDPSRFQAANRQELRLNERRSWNVTPSTSVGLFIAMNYRLKGLSPLLKAVQKIPSEIDFKLVVVGNAKYQSYLQLANRLGISDRVIFLGFRDNPRDCYFGADFLIHPTFYDPCSLVALEAIGCGLTVITTQYNGASELLPQNYQLVVNNPHNSEELSSAIIRLCDEPHRRKVSHLCTEIAQQYTWEAHFEQMLRHIQEVSELKRAS
jgi:UDP-glucose:(heptosyl)LPS alpha-1,3-glucosyltransferase